MPQYRPASATEPGGTRGRGEARRGTSTSMPSRYGKPGAKPQNATRNSVAVCRATTSATLTCHSLASSSRSAPSYRTGMVTGGGPGASLPARSARSPRSASVTASGSTPSSSSVRAPGTSSAGAGRPAAARARGTASHHPGTSAGEANSSSRACGPARTRRGVTGRREGRVRRGASAGPRDGRPWRGAPAGPRDGRPWRAVRPCILLDRYSPPRVRAALWHILPGASIPPLERRGGPEPKGADPGDSGPVARVDGVNHWQVSLRSHAPMTFAPPAALARPEELVPVAEEGAHS